MPEFPPEVVSEGSSGVLTVGDRKGTGEVTEEGSEGSSSVGVGDSVEEWKSPGKVPCGQKKEDKSRCQNHRDANQSQKHLPTPLFIGRTLSLFLILIEFRIV